MAFLCISFTEIRIYKDNSMNQIVSISHQPTTVGSKIVVNPTITTKRSTAAKRLVNTKGMEYQDWLEVRKQGIGSSDAATACGLNPYMSMLELWLIKTGRQAQSIEDESSGVACIPITRCDGSMRYFSILIPINTLC